MTAMSEQWESGNREGSGGIPPVRAIQTIVRTLTSILGKLSRSSEQRECHDLT